MYNKSPFLIKGTLSSTNTDDKPKNIYSTREENLIKKDYLYDMLDSPQNREIIKRELTTERRTKAGGVISIPPSDQEIQEVIDARKRNLRTVSVSMVDQPIGRTWESTYGIYTPEKEKSIKILQENYKRNFGWDFTFEETEKIWEDIWKEEEQEKGRKFKEHHITLQPNPSYLRQHINLEEYLHAVKGGPQEKGDLPEKTMELIDKHAKGGAGSMYQTIPHEFSAQTNIVKYIIGKTTDFDPTKDVFTEKDYNEIFNKDNKDLQNSAHLERFMKSLKVNYNKKGKYIGPDLGFPFLDPVREQTKEEKEKLKKTVIELMNNISVQVDEPLFDGSTENQSAFASVSKGGYIGGV